jgi:hypothetical protein
MGMLAEESREAKKKTISQKATLVNKSASFFSKAKTTAYDY